VTVRIGEPAGDRSVVPALRRYLVRLRMDAPPWSVVAEGHGALGRSSEAASDPGWWIDAAGFVVVRVPESSGSAVVTLAR
jgi:hypothetical protein